MGKLRVLQVIQGQTVVWEGVKEPKGVLLTFHGCSHAATDWWDMQESCPGCIGASLRLRRSRRCEWRFELHALGNRDACMTCID